MSRRFRNIIALLALLTVSAAQRAAAEDRMSLPSRPGVIRT